MDYNVLTDSRSFDEASNLMKKSWKTTIFLSVFSFAFALLPLLIPREGLTTFQLAESTDFFSIGDVVLGSFSTALISGALLAITAISALLTWRNVKSPIWLYVIFGLLLVLGFLIWAGSGATIPLTALLVSTLSVSVPLIFGAQSGVICERVGIVNVAIEGQFLAGAFSSAVVASITQNVFAGLIAAVIAGGLVSLILAIFPIRYFVDQVIVGVVLNVLVSGLTAFLFSQVLSPNAQILNSPPRLEQISVPLLSQIPIIGPVFFKQTLIVYLMYFAVFLVWYGLFQTRWGLRLRAVGEHPQAADTVGIVVNRTRFRNVLLAGVIAGIGGAYFTLGSVGSFNIQMTAGSGFIALAAVIFGRWDPVRATLAALLFGFATSLQYVLSIIGSQIPSELMLMLPYVVTILAVAGLVGAVRGPAAAGKPYVTA